MLAHSKNLILALVIVGLFSPATVVSENRCPFKSCPSSSEDGIEAFGSFSKSSRQRSAVSPVVTPTPLPFSSRQRPRITALTSATATATPTPTPTSTATATPTPTSSSSNNNSGSAESELSFLNQLLGGALTNILSGQGLGGLFSGLGGIFGGGGGIFGGGGASSGWGGADHFGGTSSVEKYGKSIDFADQYLKQIQGKEGSKEKQTPGSPRRECEGGMCETGPQAFSDASGEKPLLGPGDQVVAAYGKGRQFGDGTGVGLAKLTNSNYQALSQGKEGTEELKSLLTDYGRGDKINPVTGERQNLVVLFNCHGGGDHLQASGGGITGKEMAEAITKGGAQTGNKDFSNITIIDGGCMSCRGTTMQQMFQQDPENKSINYAAGSSRGHYAWSSGGSSHILTWALESVQSNGGTLTKSGLLGLIKHVPAGYAYRIRANQKKK